MSKLEKTVGKLGAGSYPKNIPKLFLMAKIEEKDQALHEKFSECGQNAKLWTRRCAMMLPEIERREIWRKKGFASIYDYALKVAGMSYNTTCEALRVLKKVADKPALMEVVEKKGIYAVKPVAMVATNMDQEFWAKKAMVMSKHTLEVYVAEFCKSRPGTEFEDKSGAGQIERGELRGKGNEFKESQNSDIQNFQNQCSRMSERMTLIMELEKEIASELQKLKGSEEWNKLMRELLEARKRALKELKPEVKEQADRYIPAAIRQYVLKKTNGQCAYPGCLREAEILHHTERFALGRRHDPEKIVGLCKAHERLAHLSLIANEEGAAEKWKVTKEARWHGLDQMVDAMVGEYRKKPTGATAKSDSS